MKIVSFTVLVLFYMSAAIANDSSATLAAGGLELSKSADISIESENLYISSKVIQVDYVLKNNSATDIETLVAFPLPKLMSDYEMDSSAAVSIPNPQSENFVNFEVRVNNIKIPVHIDHKAFLKNDNSQTTQDITAELKNFAIPISPFAKNYRKTLNTLPAAIANKLLAKKWLTKNSYDAGKGWVTDINGNWETQTTLYWSQVFPAHKTLLVSHEYQPVVGSSFITENGNSYHQGNLFCVDKGTEKAINKKMQLLKGTDQNLLLAHHIQYILTTAKNWQGPIGSFTLVLDKEKANNIISVCLPEIEKLNKTQFSLEYKNFVPEKDLDILIVE